jgi:hypothetical protein
LVVDMAVEMVVDKVVGRVLELTVGIVGFT